MTSRTARDSGPGAGSVPGREPGPVLGLDIGGTKLAVGVVTPDGSVHGLIVEPTTRGDWRVAVRQLFDMGRRAVTRAGLGGIRAVGIGCGGPLDAPSGLLQCPPHLPGWIDVPIGPLAAEEFGVPAVLQNDATAAALAEYRFGAGRGTRTMLYLTVSTGIGGGAVIDGQLMRGAAGNGGEFGHLTVRRGGRLCSCGRRGCVEAYASGTSIAERAREALDAAAAERALDAAAAERALDAATAERTLDATAAEPARAAPGSSLRGLKSLTAADVSAAAAGGDAVAGAVWSETVDLLGTAVTDLVNVFEPDLVVLGGGVTRAGAMLLDPVRDQVAREAMGPAAGAARVALAGLGDLVGVVGAATIAYDLLQENPRTPLENPHMPDWLETHLDEHVAVAEAMTALAEDIRSVGHLISDTYAAGGTVYTFGNGGSAADAQHFTGELIGHYKRDRRPLPAVTLSTDTSVMTCVANDYSYEDVFARQVEALARPGDVVVAFTTSGRSPNVVAGLAAAQAKGATTLLFAGGDGGPARVHADRALLVPSKSTPRIQEMHTLMLHVISEHVDAWAANEEPTA